MSNPTQSLEKLHPQSIGELIETNSGLSARAVDTIRQTMQALCTDDLQSVHIIQGDQVDEVLAELQDRAVQAISYCKESRMPITSLFDEVRKKFTSQEKAIDEALTAIKSYRSSWAAEKERRIRIAEEEKARKLAKENEKIRVAAEYEASLREAIDKAYSTVFTDIWADYTHMKLEQLQGIDLKELMKTWEGEINRLDGFAPGPEIAPRSSILDQQELHAVLADVHERAYRPAVEKAKNFALAEVNGLVQGIPARIQELQTLSEKELEARDRAEAERKKLEAEQAAAMARQELEAEQAAAKLEAALEASTAVPAVSQAKGTTKKLKYKPTTHAAFVAIITHWAQNHMAKMTIEELTKKLSFMITAANNDLKDGTELKAKGLEIVEGFTVRGRAKK